ncbi:NAD-dependent epimerase/dehydratase family protein [Conexibacter sp. DBS9H8]|uniref:NAD-dependent epimerase/dehydratase family protein n=1 Tax=Conexibacter sp. DBS9H8 TaxID=2937801 RepID=UPI00200E65DB|nr:NAD-dependent epimerase/dehydratase family protein [Conexibacter sp. DBS9H8]
MASSVVTGGAGFIGSHIVDALITRGDEVTVIDDLSTGRRENLRDALRAGATLEVLDVRDTAAVAAVFARVRPQHVFHLAAQIDVRRSVTDPWRDCETNVGGILAVLEAARRTGVERVVNTSTGGGLYGDATRLPTPEDHEILPLAPYGQSKLAAEGYAALYARLHGVSTVSLRYGNVYGPRQDVHGEAGVVAIFCGCLLEGRTPVIFGDGHQTRDWVEVSDVVAANLAAADGAGAAVTGAVNIGHGAETSLLDLVEALDRVGSRRGLRLPPPRFVAARAGEVTRSCLDVGRARAELAWRAQVGLEAGLERVLTSV